MVGLGGLEPPTSPLSDEMRRPVSSGMRYAPNDRRALKHKIKETGDEED
jgi:hypothetical protein